ncbi:phenylalanine--tRNA ligase subunit alpha [Candidatus Gracilibacteria bacterium]|nr:phenylalanine--tRNA ligase subunit alpha [Candidatus Gracilibacteria bacterium]MCF7819522.1 phenylalanine--tRNA ligase subunit alpha [Candidatus Gracilibacteria bacterium]
MKALVNRVSEFQKKARDAFEKVDSLDDLQVFYTQFLSKKSELNAFLKELKNLSDAEKKELGPHIQTVRLSLTEGFEQKQKELRKQALDEKLASDWIDVTKHYPFEKGAQHPVSQIQKRIEEIFTSMGFEIVDGPEVETEWHNFDALNIPSSHPARDMQDTFWIRSDQKNPHKNSVLRTHTSSVQIRKMMEDGVPVRMIVPGRVYRNEDVDTTHDATFYQVEGLLVDKGISLAHLKGTIHKMLSELFEKEVKIRFRPGYFPFVEPGLEVDIWFECTDRQGKKKSQWLEFMGAGMVHPNVLRNCGVDPSEYSGFAFGFGLTRLAMIHYGIEDIRLLFSQKKDFLSQF